MAPHATAMRCQRCFGIGLRDLFGSIDGAPMRVISRVPCEACDGSGHARDDADTIPGQLVDLADHEFDLERRLR